jgi:hypothetical protein
LAFVGLVLSVTLTGCGGGDPEADARAELKKLGFSKTMEDCAIAGIKKEAGSLEKFMDLKASKQQTIAAEAGADCAENMSEDEFGDLAENLDEGGVDFNDPTFRKSFITGMTGQGVPESVANCILDKMVDQDLAMTDVTDPEIMARLAQECQ